MISAGLTIASFWAHRPVEHPNAADYPGLLRILQRSCDRLGLRHIVLTDRATRASDLWPAGVDAWATDLPVPLMQACTEVQARFLEFTVDWPARPDVLLVGADCILLDDPNRHFPAEPDLCVTSRAPSRLLDAINTGAMLVRHRAIDRAATLYRRVADRCGTVWRDDQKALVAELSPVPLVPGTHERAGLTVGFLPMKRFNQTPLWAGDPCKGAVLLHFKGKAGKKLMFEWAKRHGFA